MGTQADPRFWTFDAAIMDVAIDPLGGGIAVGLADGRIGIIDPIDGSLTLYSVHAGAVQQVVHDAVGARFVSAGDDGAIMRTMGDEASICVAQLGTRWIEALTTDPSTGVLYAAMGSELFAINHKGAQKFARLVSTPGALTWDSATDSLLVSHYGGVGRWHRDDLDQPARSFEWKGAHLAASASPDGRWVVSATQDGSLHVWPTDGSEDLGMRGYLAKPVSMAWTPDSAQLLTSGLDNLVGWSFDGEGPRGRDPKMLGWGGGGLVSQVALHPVAPLAITGFDNGAVIFTDLELEEYGVIEMPRGAAVTKVLWTGDGRAVVVADDDGRLSLYDT